MSIHNFFRYLVLGVGPAVVALAAVATLAPDCQSQSREQIRDLNNAREQLQELRTHAASLKEAGRHDKAEEVAKKAAALARRIEESRKRTQHRGQDRDLKLQKIMNGLEAGIHALRELGLKEEAARLLKIARGARELYNKEYRGEPRDKQRKRDTGPETERRRAAERKQRAKRDTGPETERKRRAERKQRADRDNEEQANARRPLQTFRFAKAIYAEMGNEKAVEMVERVMHARELAIEGRRDREAKQIMERAPGVGNQVELLNYAAMVADKKRPTDRGANMRKLAKQLAAGRKRKPRDERRERDHRRDHEKEADSLQRAMGELNERIKKLQLRLNKLREETRRHRRDQ